MIRSLNFSARRTVPNLVITQRILGKMAIAARHYVQDETGEALVGLVVPGDNTNGIETIYVLDTISPDESAVRQLHTFQQGDERQDEIIWWLQENWQIYRKKRRNSYGQALQAKWDVPLRYLGDWHKQPGFMIAPSSGDQRTALNWLDDDSNEMNFLLAPIVTLGHPSTTMSIASTSNFVTMPQGDSLHMRVDFWFIDRETRLFQPMVPAIYPDDQLPGLPEYPWHLKDQGRSSKEFALMHEDQLFTSIVLWNADEDPPLEVCFMVARVGSDRVLLIVTSWNYPEKAPSARVAPFMKMGPGDDLYGVFAQLWEKSTPVDDPAGWTWTKDKHLVDYIRALESSLNMATSDKALTGEITVAASDEPDDDDDDEGIILASDAEAQPPQAASAPVVAEPADDEENEFDTRPVPPIESVPTEEKKP